MPIEGSQRLYVGETFWFRIPDVRLNGVLVTDAAPPSSFTCQLTDRAGTAVGSAVAMTESNTTAGTWEVEMTAPATRGMYHLHAVAVSGSSQGKWHDSVYVYAYT